MSLSYHMEITIRPARPADLSRILEVLAAFNMHIYGHEERPEMPPLEHFIVAEDGDRIVGCASYVLDHQTEVTSHPDEAETASLAVLPEYQKKGLGSLLHSYRMKVLYERGIKVVCTETDAEWLIDWYVRCFGYKVISSRPKKFLHASNPNYPNFTLLKCDLKSWYEENHAKDFSRLCVS